MEVALVGGCLLAFVCGIAVSKGHRCIGNAKFKRRVREECERAIYGRPLRRKERKAMEEKCRIIHMSECAAVNLNEPGTVPTAGRRTTLGNVYLRAIPEPMPAYTPSPNPASPEQGQVAVVDPSYTADANYSQYVTQTFNTTDVNYGQYATQPYNTVVEEPK
ncbi:hypothetical protein TWF718_003773 [Orbilia javanica]|uniref:Uncharacterized protein n=1 Tax=Orbilia javanica TaxID=47235 RepID=A0AAN8MTW3_9PEZI